MVNIQTVTVIGVTGTMGANVAGIFASFGDVKVYCVGRYIEKVKKTIQRIVNSVKAYAIAKNMIPADFSTLEQCVAEIVGRVGKSLRKTAVSCTGTSGLSIITLAECYPEELGGRFFGVHMFNPSYHMLLCGLKT